MQPTTFSDEQANKMSSNTKKNHIENEDYTRQQRK